MNTAKLNYHSWLVLFRGRIVKEISRQCFNLLYGQSEKLLVLKLKDHLYNLIIVS